jgi:hypothetical protein
MTMEGQVNVSLTELQKNQSERKVFKPKIGCGLESHPIFMRGFN